MSEQENNAKTEGHIWDVESSAPQDLDETQPEEKVEGHLSSDGKAGYIAITLMLLSFVLPIFLEPWSLLVPVAIGAYGLIWAWTKRKTNSHAGLVSAIIVTVFLMMGAGIVAMQTIPDEAWTDVLSLLFYAGWIILIPALSGIAYILWKQKGKLNLR